MWCEQNAEEKELVRFLVWFLYTVGFAGPAMREVELKEPVWAPPNTMMINNDTNNNNNNNSNNKKKDRKEEKKRWLKDIHYMHRKKKRPIQTVRLGIASAAWSSPCGPSTQKSHRYIWEYIRLKTGAVVRRGQESAAAATATRSTQSTFLRS